MEETVRTMDDLVRQGKILYWGFSEWPAEVIAQCTQICEKGGYEKPRGSQPNYSLLNRRIEEKILPICQGNGIGQVVFSPLAQGVLTGKYKPGQPLPEGSRAADDKQNQFIRRHLDDQQMLERVQKLVPIAEEVGCTMAQLALAWILRRPEVTSCIIGATRPEQIAENVEASGIKLEPAIVARIEAAIGG
jgi:aryl-alcohol dehydrogenase-like predicted oxidoreductase